MSARDGQLLIPTLHNLRHSQSLRVLWALEELSSARGTRFKLKNYVRSRDPNPELVAVHRLGKAPVMTLETSDASPVPTIQIEPGVLTESKLILQWLSDEFGGDLWIPAKAEDRRSDVFFSEFATNTLYATIGSTVTFDVLPGFMPFPLSYLSRLITAPVVRYWLSALQPIFQLMEDHLSDGKPYFAGQKLGLSDIHVSWGMDMAQGRGYLDVARFPMLKAWGDRIRAREAYKKALERTDGYDMKNFGQ